MRFARPGLCAPGNEAGCFLMKGLFELGIFFFGMTVVRNMRWRRRD